MKDDPVYTPSDCFENFPFADDSGALSGIGAEYYRTRASYMVVNNEGITTTYNRFHDPNERRPAILNLRELHDAMDRAVLDAYGWTDIRPRCQFIAEHENEEVAETSSRRTRSWRYRWPDDVRDEVLARLLALNAERAKSQKAISSTTELKDGKDRPKKRETPLFNT